MEPSERRAQLEEIAGHLESACAKFDARDFDGCIALCQLVLAKDPEYTVARELADDAAKMKERERIDVLKRMHVRELADALTLAFDRFDARDFDGCIACCTWVLAREPKYSVAEELAEDAEKVRGREHYYDFLRAKVENWKRRTSTGDEAEVPYPETLTYPHLAGFRAPAQATSATGN